MLGDININIDLPQYDLALCKPNREIIAYLPEAYNIVYSPRFVGVSEMYFKLPYYIMQNGKQIVNPNFNLCKGDYLVLVNNEQYFIINKPSNSGGDNDYKELHCFSQEYELASKLIRGYKGTKKIYDVSDPENSILTYIISLAPSWSVGSVDSDLLNVYRTFDISEKNILEFVEDLQKSFSCIFQFNTLDKTINVIALSAFLNTDSNPPYVTEVYNAE